MERILYTLSQIPQKTGSGMFVRAIIEKGHQKNIKQALLAGVPKGFKDLELSKKLEEFFKIEFESEKLPFCVVGMSDQMPYESTKFYEMDEVMKNSYFIEFEKEIKNAIEIFKPTKIITNHLWWMSCIIANLNLEIPVVAICHSTDLRQFQSLENEQMYIKNSIKKIDKILTLSKNQQEEINALLDISKNKMELISSGFSSEIFFEPNQKPKDKIHISFAGKLSFSKGLMELIDVVDLIKEDIVLHIAGTGRGQEERDIQKRASNSKKVIMEGFLNSKELSELFRKTHIFVLPSYYEGMPLVILEALACKNRIVASNLLSINSAFDLFLKYENIFNLVDIPKMKSIDKPFEEDIENFKIRLKNKIEFMIENCKKEPLFYNEDLKKDLEKFTWDKVFQKIIKD